MFTLQNLWNEINKNCMKTAFIKRLRTSESEAMCSLYCIIEHTHTTYIYHARSRMLNLLTTLNTQ